MPIKVPPIKLIPVPRVRKRGLAPAVAAEHLKKIISGFPSLPIQAVRSALAFAERRVGHLDDPRSKHVRRLRSGLGIVGM